MRKVALCILGLLALGPLSTAQTVLGEKFKSDAINKIVLLLNDNYVFPAVAAKTGEHLKRQFDQGRFKDADNMAAFASLVTEVVQSVAHDKHLRVRSMTTRRTGRSMDSGVAGFKEVKMLENNIGYIDLRGFVGNEIGEPATDGHMNMMARAKAIIIDLRENGGGNPYMVQYVASYFFNKKVHLNSLYYREGNRTIDFWTVDVRGDKMPDTPLYILTSKKTFSAGEEFAYNMQTQKRAKLIGETTGGGANPGANFTINEDLNIFIPTGSAVNPITKKNWEGIGVVPEVTTSAEKALDVALHLIGMK